MSTILIGYKTLFIIELNKKLKDKNIKYFIEYYKLIGLIQISWHTKGGNLKTRINVSKAYPFCTKIGNIEHHSNNIESVIRLIK